MTLYRIIELLENDNYSFRLFQKFYDPIKSHCLFKLNYLNSDFDYYEVNTNKIYGGDELMNVGLSIPLVKNDFHAFEFHLKKVD